MRLWMKEHTRTQHITAFGFCLIPVAKFCQHISILFLLQIMRRRIRGAGREVGNCRRGGEQRRGEEIHLHAYLCSELPIFVLWSCSVEEESRNWLGWSGLGRC